jgi:TnpA family transposase
MAAGPELRRRSHVGLNKGQQQNALRRASGLNLLVAAIILWNTTYLQRPVDHQ